MNPITWLELQRYAPHGYCLIWSEPLLWTYVAADSVIALSYFSIPVALFYFMRRRGDLGFKKIFLMFGLFILACGLTHVMDVWKLWRPDYWADAALRSFTAVISLGTAVLLWRLLPAALRVPSPAMLHAQNELLETEVAQRQQLESELRAQRSAFKHQALHDSLTGLPNRALLEDRLAQALVQAGRTDKPFALAFVDLDDFKGVNDKHGHEMGDRLLHTVAERLVQSVRKSDTVARLGGDEFVLVLTNLASEADASLVANKILTRFAEPVDLGETSLLVGLSLGLALYPAHGTTAEDLLKHADEALYQTKAEGKNAFRLYAPL